MVGDLQHPDPQIPAGAFEGMGEAVVIFDSAGRFVYASERITAHLGRTTDELIGKVLSEEFPNGVGSRLSQLVQQVIDSREPLDVIDRIPQAETWVEHRLFPYDGGAIVLSRDVTERQLIDTKKSEMLERTLEAHRFSEALNTISAELTAETDVEGVIARLVEEGRAALGADRAAMGMLTDGELVVTAISGDSPVSVGEVLDRSLLPHTGIAAESKAVAAVDDIPHNPLYGAHASEHLRASAVLSVPLFAEGELLGFLSFYTQESHHWSSAQRDFAAKLGLVASLALESVRSTQELTRKERLYRSVFDLAGAGIARVGGDGRFLEVNQVLCAITGYSREELLELTYQDITYGEDLDDDVDQANRLIEGEIECYSLEKRYVRKDQKLTWINLTVSSVREPDGAIDYFVAIIEDINARKEAEAELMAAREREDLLTRLLDDSAQPFAVTRPNGELVMCNEAFVELTGYTATDLQEPASWGERLTPAESRAQEEALFKELLEDRLPVRYEKQIVRTDGQRIPVEVFAHSYVDDAGRQLIYSFITDITERVLFVEAARLSDALNEIDGEVNRSLDFEDIMNSMLARAADALYADTASVTLLDGDRYRLTHVYNFPDEYVGRLLPRSDLPHAELAVAERMTVAINDALSDPRTNHDVIKSYNVRSVMVVPLSRGNDVYGAIFFNHASEVRPFTKAQVDFATRLGAHVSLAVENARLYEAEHRVAETLQEALLTLPDSVPGVDFAHKYCSSSTIARVGGDFYDLFELENGRLGIVIGDVSGKGLEAAVLTSRAKAMLRAECGSGDCTPAHVLRRVNDSLVRDSAPETFFTVFLGLLNRADGEFVYSSGGHTTSAIIHEGGAVDRLCSTGPVVGAFAGLEFANGYSTMEPGAMVVGYTDGLIEARGPQGMYGEQRLFAQLANMAGRDTRHVVDGMVADVSDFAAALTDDIAILALQRKKAYR